MIQIDNEVAMIRETARRFVRNRLVPLEQQIETDDDVSVELLAQLRSEVAALACRQRPSLRFSKSLRIRRCR
jgi:hypothetical protein